MGLGHGSAAGFHWKGTCSYTGTPPAVRAARLVCSFGSCVSAVLHAEYPESDLTFAFGPLFVLSFPSQPPEGSISLASRAYQCVRLVTRDSCARPHTFELVSNKAHQEDSGVTLVK